MGTFASSGAAPVGDLGGDLQRSPAGAARLRADGARLIATLLRWRSLQIPLGFLRVNTQVRARVRARARVRVRVRARVRVRV